jgi:hypothetical protein
MAGRDTFRLPCSMTETNVSLVGIVIALSEMMQKCQSERPAVSRFGRDTRQHPFDCPRKVTLALLSCL